MFFFKTKKTLFKNLEKLGEVSESWMTLAEDVIQRAKCPHPNNNPPEDHAAKAAGKKPEPSMELTFSWHAPSHRGAFLTLSH